MTNTSLPAIVKTLTQVHGVEHVNAYPETTAAVTHRVLVFTADATIDASVTSNKDLDELAEIVETYTTDALVNKKFKLNYRITL